MSRIFNLPFLIGILLLVVLILPSRGSAEESNEAWFRGAAERIEKCRKADAVVSVVDQAGKPVRDARVTIEQTRHAFLFGCNFFQFDRLKDSAAQRAYRTQFAQLFNYATLPFYWPSYEPRQGMPRYDDTERAARWCKEHGITVKGHPLAWNFMEPSWLPDDVTEIKRLQLARITDCVSRFRALIDNWDVVNEATHFEREALKKRAPKMTRMWEQVGRVAFVDQCFQAARQAGPEATLLINDYRTDPQYADLIGQMARPHGKSEYDVIGIQSHMHGGVWNNQKIADVCQRFARFGVPLHFTELTILSGEEVWEGPQPWNSTPEGEKRQAEKVRRIYTMLFSQPEVTAITWWDFSDHAAWKGAPAGLLDKEFKPKPAYRALHHLVKKQWWTTIQRATDADGQVPFRGFLGDYKVTVSLKDGRAFHGHLSLTVGTKDDLRIMVQ